MSTSLLYHGWGLKGYHYVRTDYPQGQMSMRFCRLAGILSNKTHSFG